MESLQSILNKFILQSKSGELKTSSYLKEWDNLKMKTSFGMGAPARVPWIAFTAPEMNVSKGFYPVYLYYKDLETLILAYGVSETEESSRSWPIEIINSAESILAHFDQLVPRYGSSFVFKSYKIKTNDNKVEYVYDTTGKKATEKDLESDLSTILKYYKNVISEASATPTTEENQGLFYIEKQLEDFIIHNWEQTDLGKRFDLIIEDGELLSQQFRTEIGPIDILAIDKITKDYVVIELKKAQTSDDTIGQLARYMGWIKENKGTNVKGIIIVGEYDKKLDYAFKVVQNVEVFLYKVDFELAKFSREK